MLVAFSRDNVEVPLKRYEDILTLLNGPLPRVKRRCDSKRFLLCFQKALVKSHRCTGCKLQMKPKGFAYQVHKDFKNSHSVRLRKVTTVKPIAVPELATTAGVRPLSSRHYETSVADRTRVAIKESRPRKRRFFAFS